MTAKASADATPWIKPTFTTGPEATTSTIQKDVEARTTADEKIAAGTATMKVAIRTVAATKGVDVTAVAVTDAEKDGRHDRCPEGCLQSRTQGTARGLP